MKQIESGPNGVVWGLIRLEVSITERALPDATQPVDTGFESEVGLAPSRSGAPGCTV